MHLPFDPSRAAGALRPEDDCSDAPLTVTALSNLIRGVLERKFSAPVRVVGEVSNLSARNHWYFSLKDAESVICCVAWASTARRFGFVPADGDEVIAVGKIGHYGVQGRTQLYVDELVPVGAGALEIRFRKMCEELRGLGYFAEERKRPLPLFPRRIAVITSAGGAAVQDVIRTAAQRCRAIGLVVVDVRVQGDGAAAQIAGAVGWVNRCRDRLGVDAILVTRGGGSMEDLWAFNERVVAEAIFSSALPVVAAIGHESDTTVAELVADLRCSTPTQAAMRLVPDAAELHRQLDHNGHRLSLLARRVFDHGRQRLDVVIRHETFRDPRRRVRAARHHLDHLRRHLGHTMRRRCAEQRARLERLAGRWSALPVAIVVDRRRQHLALLEDRLGRALAGRVRQRRPQLERLRRDLSIAAARTVKQHARTLEGLERRLSAVDPRQVLARGFTYTTRADGTLVRRTADAPSGAELVTHVSDGTIRSVVGESRAPSRKRDRRADEPSGLFE